ncbi:MAG: PIG-L family deacetylase [Bacilli bacterium]|nr:PIG-L family deacetylase [Bacilli bacterium]
MAKIKDIITKNKKIIITGLIVLIILLSGCIIYMHNTYKIHPNIKKINLNGYNKLMIVAHPDDETLWGGKALIEDDYLVVCITCGKVKSRVFEFVNVMHTTNDKYIMLGYPDKTNGERDNWDTVYEDITKDLKEIIKLKDWELIVVHNPEGEYGHIHHKMISNIVTDIVENKDILYYFGKYYSKKTIRDHYDELVSMSEKTLNTKKKIIGMYHTQDFIQTSFDQMFPYENWVPYTEWMSENEES